MLDIRKFTSEDQKAIQNLITKVMGDEFREDQDAYPTGDIVDISKSYGAVGEAFFVAVDGKKVVGTVAIKREDDRVALLRRLFVAKSHRSKKIGTKLIDRALQFCEEVGYHEVIFRTTSRMQGAGKVCEKSGFVQRAKIQLGPFELLKYVLHLRNGSVKI